MMFVTLLLELVLPKVWWIEEKELEEFIALQWFLILAESKLKKLEGLVCGICCETQFFFKPNVETQKRNGNLMSFIGQKLIFSLTINKVQPRSYLSEWK